MLRLHCFEIEDRHFWSVFSRGAKSFHGILGKSIGSADQPAVLAAVGAPDQGFVFKSNSSTPLLVSITSGPDTAIRPSSDTAILEQVAAVNPAPPGSAFALPPTSAMTATPALRAWAMARIKFGDRKLASVRLLQTNSAAIQKKQNGLRQVFVIACRADQANYLGAAHFGKGAAHELAFLGSNEYILAVQLTAADDHPVVEGRRQVEQMKMRALNTLGRS